MKARWILAALFLGTCSLSVLAQSEPPAPPEESQPPQDEPADEQTKPTILERGAEDAPVFIAIHNGPSTATESQQNESKAKRESPEWWMVGLSGGILFVMTVQAILFLCQLRLIRKSLKPAEEAALAAKETVDAMRDNAAAELRAWVSITPDLTEPSHGTFKDQFED